MTTSYPKYPETQPASNKTNPYKQENKVSVFIITGFLGAGKTTLLNSLLTQFASQNNFIIENEFGQVNIDKNLIAGNVQKVFEITNGCLCCNLDAELYDALDQVARLEKRPNNLFIETTGIADAGNLSAIFKEDFVMEVFDLKKIICMADAEVIEDFLGKTPEAGRQIVASDLIILNKSLNVSTHYLNELQGNISRMNPYATIKQTSDGSIDKHLILKPNPSKPLFSLDSTSPNNKTKTTSHDITSVYYETDEAFDIEKLEMLLRTSLFIYYKDIYRIKGYVKNAKGEFYLLQSAGKTISISLSSNYNGNNFLVFIGRKLTIEIAERLLHSARAQG